MTWGPGRLPERTSLRLISGVISCRPGCDPKPSSVVGSLLLGVANTEPGTAAGGQSWGLELTDTAPAPTMPGEFVVLLAGNQGTLWIVSRRAPTEERPCRWGCHMQPAPITLGPR